MALSLSDLLRRMLEMSGSDLHITTNSRPNPRPRTSGAARLAAINAG